MKRILLLITILIFVENIKAQKFAYVDSQYILEHITEYKQAKQELDNISYQWQEEIETAYQDIDKLYRAYQTDKVLLTDKMRQDREDEIIEKEKEAPGFKDYVMNFLKQEKDKVLDKGEKGKGKTMTGEPATKVDTKPEIKYNH